MKYFELTKKHIISKFVVCSEGVLRRKFIHSNDFFLKSKNCRYSNKRSYKRAENSKKLELKNLREDLTNRK